MNRRVFLSSLWLLVFLPGCGNESRPLPETVSPPPILELPGTLLQPDSSGFTPLATDSLAGLLLYLWIPLDRCDLHDPDLVFLASLVVDSILPAPVMFDHHTRNAAQCRVNALGLPLTVYLGDQHLRVFMEGAVLPRALLVLPGGEVYRADGVGCPQRVLRNVR